MAAAGLLRPVVPFADDLGGAAYPAAATVATVAADRAVLAVLTLEIEGVGPGDAACDLSTTDLVPFASSCLGGPDIDRGVRVVAVLVRCVLGDGLRVPL